MNTDKNIWESDDGLLYLRRQVTDKDIVWVETGRIKFVVALGLLTVEYLEKSWFLACHSESQYIELLSEAEMLQVAGFLGLTPQEM